MSLDLSQILAALPSPKSSPSRLSNETTNRLSASHDIQTLRAVSPSNTSAGASARVDGDDPFAMFLSRSSRGKRACRVSRWLKDLHNQSSALTPTGADPFGIDPMDPRCHPYPASSHPTSTVLDDNDSMNDYVVVSNAEEQNPIASQSCEATRIPDDASALTDTASPRSTIRLSNNTPSRHDCQAAVDCPHSPSRPSLIQPSLQRLGHARTPSSASRQHPPASWRWRSPVLGHFQSASVPNARLTPDPDRSRPSVSSTNTCSSTPTMHTTKHGSSDSPYLSSTPSKASSIFGSFRSRVERTQTSPSPSDCHISPSHSGSSSCLPGPPGLFPPLSRKQSIRLPFRSRSKQNQASAEDQNKFQPHVLYSSRSNGPRMSLSSITSQSRKKKLVISGIPPDDAVRLENVKTWCSSFGEVDQMIRMRNGDIHVNFRKAEVADTVCRVRARVQIAGVGSVSLSWMNGNKR